MDAIKSRELGQCQAPGGLASQLWPCEHWASVSAAAGLSRQCQAGAWLWHVVRATLADWGLKGDACMARPKALIIDGIKSPGDQWLYLFPSLSATLELTYPWA
ncbi:hypothetical protein HaLaN_32459 [Haematococcus lacustris]|uniref:Uncharacterized protein n=1 Tax=Haematococcus lacustris TaxID=44745 RepID=A0A6A0AJZ0_HAELA|nr:hypothetical protein HaLaN_32459 [Haematococcus lacustris]